MYAIRSYYDDDLGQMSAWYVFSAMGFYPFTHGEGLYYIGTPMFRELRLKHSKGKLTIKANNLSDENIYVQSLTLNGIPYSKNYLNHSEIFNDDAELIFQMGDKPNMNWGNTNDAIPRNNFV